MGHIKCLYTTPYNSRSNSKCEMNNKKALNCFRLLHQTLPGGLNEDYLAIYCAGIANCLNNLPLQSLEGVSPQYIMTGQSENVATYIPCSSVNIICTNTMVICMKFYMRYILNKERNL